MFNGLNNKLANVPTITGLSDITSDTVTSSNVATNSLTVNGVDVTGVINQVPINTADITALKQITTGQTYASSGDTTTFDNNMSITGALTLNNNLLLTTPAITLSQTELSYLDGVTSNIQAQLTSLQQITTGQTYFSGTDLTTFDNNMKVNKTLYLDGSIGIAVAGSGGAPIELTQTELSYLDGVTSNIQQQLNTIPLSTNFVTTNTTQTITGAKTFTNAIAYNGGSPNDIVIGPVTGATSSLQINNNNTAASQGIYFNLGGGGTTFSMGLLQYTSLATLYISGSIRLNAITNCNNYSDFYTTETTCETSISNWGVLTGSFVFNQRVRTSGVQSQKLLDISAAKQIIAGAGTDFNVVLTGDGNSTAGKTMRLFSSGTNMYIDCGTGYTTGSTPLLFRTGAGVERMRMNDLGLVMNATCVYGRNDQYDFVTLPSGALTEPIGFTEEYNETAVTFTAGSAFNYTTVLPLLGNGVWTATVNMTVSKGTGTFATNSFIRAFFTTATGVSFYPSINNGTRTSVASTTLVDPITCSYTSILIVKSATPVRPNIQGQIQIGTVGTATKALNVVFTKIA